MKKCKKCGETKEDNQFWANPKTRDKLKSSCIDCTKEYNKQHYKENREYRIKQVKKWKEDKIRHVID